MDRKTCSACCHLAHLPQARKAALKLTIVFLKRKLSIMHRKPKARCHCCAVPHAVITSSWFLLLFPIMYTEHAMHAMHAVAWPVYKSTPLPCPRNQVHGCVAEGGGGLCRCSELEEMQRPAPFAASHLGDLGHRLRGVPRRRLARACEARYP